MRHWLLVTIALGAAFLANQLVEYTTLPFRPSSHTYGSIYWLLTGLHSAHVATGLAALLALVVRTVRAARPADLTTWTVAISAFWHLVDAVWIAVFLTIWVIR
jgi:cytochrome c oxidase subunit 3